MNQRNEILEIQELVFAVLPVWNYRIAKPMKQILNDGISLEMYYCLQTLRCCENGLTMTELAHWIDMPKQQLTKLVNRLVERHFVQRIYDPNDRRIIRIKATETATDYIDSFLTHDAEYLKTLLENMDETDRVHFKEALQTFIRILVN